MTVAAAVDAVAVEDPLLHAIATTPATSRLNANATARKSWDDVNFAATECLLRL
jgi:hypothetical protein